MAKSGVKVTVDNVARSLAAINQLVKREVLVGIPDANAERYEDYKNAKKHGKALGGFSNAQIGYVQENGSPAINLPARPFLVPGVRDARASFIPHLREATRQALRGNVAECDKALHKAGMVAQNFVRAKINSNLPPALAERTLAARRARGRTGTVPLIDTGQLRNSITYVLVK